MSWSILEHPFDLEITRVDYLKYIYYLDFCYAHKKFEGMCEVEGVGRAYFFWVIRHTFLVKKIYW